MTTRSAAPGRLAVAWLCLVVVGLLLRAGVPPAPLPSAAAAPAPAAPSITGLRVSGNRILNGAGEPVRLLGVNRSGAEYACVQGWGIFEGPTDAASVQAIKAWNANVVRIPMNETCWLGINGVDPAYGGASYRTAIADYVSLLTSQGLAVILDLHWSAPGTQPATGLQPMPNRDHSPEFWRQVAAAHKGNSSVIFDLFNEPFPDSNRDTAAAWTCWRDGGTCPGVTFQAAGMQELVNAVRGTGATNVILLGGVQYSNALSQWLTYKPNDPTGNLAASWHVYNFNPCKDVTCWDANVGPVAQQVPLVTGEIGQDDCRHWFIDDVMGWLDARGQSYLGWTWNTWDCAGGPALITDYAGTPTQTFGQGFKDHLAALGSGTPPSTATPTPTPTGAATPTRTATPTGPATATPTVGPAPSFTTGAGVAPDSVAPGGSVAITAAVTSATATTALVDVEVYSPAGAKVFQQWFDNEAFAAGQRKEYPVTWRVPTTATSAAHVVKIGVFAPNWGTLYHWNDAAAQFSVATAVPPNAGTATPTGTPTRTPSPLPTATPTPLPIRTVTPTPTPTGTPTPTRTAAPSIGAPGNDAFGAAAPLGALPAHHTALTSGATIEAAEPRAVCGTSATLGKTVWYTFTPATSGQVRISTAGSDFDTVVTVYTGSSLGGLSRRACANDAGGSAQAAVAFRAKAGNTYSIQVGGYGGASGNLVLDVTAR